MTVCTFTATNGSHCTGTFDVIEASGLVHVTPFTQYGELLLPLEPIPMHWSDITVVNIERELNG